MSTSWGNGPVQVRLTIGQTTLTQADIRAFSHRTACCDGDIGLGQVCAATLTATLTGARDLLNETITAELGAGDPLVWHELGTFVVTQCQRGEDSTTVSACDAAWYALSAVYAPTVDSGADVYDVLEDLADQCGLDVEQTTLNLGLGISVTGDLTGHTCRAMLGYLAALCGRNCVISRAGALRFVWFAASGAGIDADTTYAGANTHCGLSTLTGLRCTVSDGSGETALTAGDADTAVEFSCPYMTQTRLDALWNTLGGYQYPVLEVSCYGGAEVQPGDLVTVTDLAGNSLSVPVMEVSLSVDGGCRCTLRSYGKGDMARASDSIGPRELRLQRVEQTAGFAMQSANGKNKVFHQASAPAVAAGLTAGDIWFDTANGNRISTWTGTAWSAFTLQNQAISNLDVGAITTGRLSAARVDVEDIFAQDITATGIIRGARFTTGGSFSVDQQGLLYSEDGSFLNGWFSECEMTNGTIETCTCEDMLFFIEWWSNPPPPGEAEDPDEPRVYSQRVYRLGAEPSGFTIDAAVLPGWTSEDVTPQEYQSPAEMWEYASNIVPVVRVSADSNGGSLNVNGTILGYGSNYNYLRLVDLGTFSTGGAFQDFYASSGLKEDISSGTFLKAIVGGYVTIAGYKFIFAHPDYWLNTGDTACATHHMLVVPASTLGTCNMNTSNTTLGAYANSYMRTGIGVGLAAAYSIIINCFGADNLLTHREYFQNATSNGYESGGGWYDSRVDLMNERMVYGADVFHNTVHGSNFPNCYTIDKTQLALFRERPDLITIRQYWWLRDVASSVAFCYVAGNGTAGQAQASDSVGVRPVFAIC